MASGLNDSIAAVQKSDSVRFSPLDSLYCDLAAAGGEKPADFQKLKEKSFDYGDSWILYTITKLFLKNGMLKEALETAAHSLEVNTENVFILNLVIKNLAFTGDREMASRLCDTSLSLSPLQNDIKQINESLKDSSAKFAPPYLEARPLYANFAFYIPAYNVEKYIRPCIEGICSLNYPVSDILVVDDGSKDGSAAIASRYPVRIISHGCNKGLAAARNTAFSSSSADFMAAVDTDAVPDISFLKYIAVEMENSPPSCAGWGGRLYEKYTDTPSDKWRSVHLSQDPGPRRKYGNDFLYGSNTVFSRKAVIASGGYDEKYKTNYEDVSMGERLKKNGFNTLYTPLASALHHRRDTTTSIMKTRWNWFFWPHEQSGFYSGPKNVAAKIKSNILWAVNYINSDLKSGNNELLPLDCLYLFFDTITDIKYAEKSGSINASYSAELTGSIMAALKNLDGRRGGRLYEYITSGLESAGLYCGNDIFTPANDFSGETASLLKDFSTFYHGITDGLYSLLVNRRAGAA
jgi:glycosyltransferase involved in cell wall biosynthesis